MTRAAFLIGLCLCTPAFSQSLPPLPQGEFQVDECREDFAEQVITISDRTIYFYESQCDMRSGTPVEGIDGAVMYEALCAGEGEIWGQYFLIAPSWDDGVIILQDRLAVTYARCTSPPGQK